MSKDDELALLILDDSVVHELDRQFEEDCSHAIEMRSEEFRQRGSLRKIKAKFLGLFPQHM